MEDVELVAICDVDEAKVSFIADKYDVPRVYYDFQNLFFRNDDSGLCRHIKFPLFYVEHCLLCS